MVTTFLPFVSFKESVACLDNQRLGKQRVEASQIIDAIDKMYNGDVHGYIKHPATRMWIGYEDALRYYYNLCLDEWERRGFSNTMERKPVPEEIEYPWYIGWIHFHQSHQASLMRKHPVYYREKFTVDDFYLQRGYIWPSHHEDQIEDVLSVESGFDTYKSYNSHLEKWLPLFAPINTNTIKSISQSKKQMYTVASLRQMCRERGIKGYSQMNKEDLLDILDIDTSDK